MKKPAHEWKYAFIFLALGVACVVSAAQHEVRWLQLLEVNTGLAFGGVGLAYGKVGPRIFGKLSNGRMPFWSYLVFWPYFTLNQFSLWLFRRTARENACDQVASGLWLGCQLRSHDEQRFEPKIQSTLDLTCEFAEAPFLRSGRYLCLPLLDTTAPTLEQLQTGVDWIEAQREQGEVFVHCALGHGRSGLFVLAWMLRTGRANSAELALAELKKLRPGVGLHPGQMVLLKQFASNIGVA